jgi:hypothetical protein
VITTSNHHGQVRRGFRCASPPRALSVRGADCVTAVGAADSRTAPQAVQKREAVLTEAPQFVQYEVKVITRALLASPQEPRRVQDPAIDCRKNNCVAGYSVLSGSQR